jgi:hypothetical protein
MVLVQRKNLDDVEETDMRFNSPPPSTGMPVHSRSIVHVALSHRSETCCNCECHHNSARDSTLDQNDADPEFAKQSGLNKGSV